MLKERNDTPPAPLATLPEIKELIMNLSSRVPAVITDMIVMDHLTFSDMEQPHLFYLRHKVDSYCYQLIREMAAAPVVRLIELVADDAVAIADSPSLRSHMKNNQRSCQAGVTGVVTESWNGDADSLRGVQSLQFNQNCRACMRLTLRKPNRNGFLGMSLTAVLIDEGQLHIFPTITLQLLRTVRKMCLLYVCVVCAWCAWYVCCICVVCVLYGCVLYACSFAPVEAWCIDRLRYC